MSHPDPTREYGDHPEERESKRQRTINRLPAIHKHAHNKGGLLGNLKALMNTKHFGAKHGARHQEAKSRALKKARGESVDKF